MQIKTHIKEALDKAEVIIITAGAGMGVDSGLILEEKMAFGEPIRICKTRYRF